MKKIPTDLQRFLNNCYAQAKDLIASAKQLASVPHLSYLLIVNAMEEMGKAELAKITVLGSQKSDSSALLKMGDDHVKKLFWAIWSKSFGRDLISQEQIEKYTNLAKAIHEKRMQAQYVSLDLQNQSSPRELISKKEATDILNMAEACLQLQENFEIAELNSTEKASMDWFVEANSDPEKRKLIWGSSSQKKLIELKHPRKWVVWLKEQFDEAQKDALDLSKKEIARKAQLDSRKLKFKMKFRLYTDSHKVKPAKLKWWNDGVESIKLIPINGKDDQLIAQITFPESFTVHTLYWGGWTMCRRFVTALNIGTMGFWWWNVSPNRERYYEELQDLESKSKFFLQPDKKLVIGWKRGSLTENELKTVAICMGALPNDKSEHEPFDHYLTGLGFLAVTDVNLRFEANCYEEFFYALRTGMACFGHFKAGEEFKIKMKEFINDIAPELEPAEFERYYAMGVQFDNRPQQLKVPDLSDVAVMKIWCDAFFLRELKRRTQEKVKSSKT